MVFNRVEVVKGTLIIFSTSTSAHSTKPTLAFRKDIVSARLAWEPPSVSPAHSSCFLRLPSPGGSPETLHIACTTEELGMIYSQLTRACGGLSGHRETGPTRGQRRISPLNQFFQHKGE